MSNSKKSPRFLKTPDPILWNAGEPERRPSLAVLERAIGGGAKPGPQAQRPAVRERVFTRELRQVTGAVLGHEPAPALTPRAKKREHLRPLTPPPDRPKPWLKSTVVASPGDTSEIDLPKAAPPPEVLIIESEDLSPQGESIRGSTNISETIVVEDAGPPVPEPEPEPALEQRKPKPQAVRRPEPLTGGQPASPAASRPEPPAVSQPEPPAVIRPERPAVSQPEPPTGNLAGGASINDETRATQPAPVFGSVNQDWQETQIVEVPEFPVREPEFEIPDAPEQEQIVTLPGLPEQPRIADLPADSVAATARAEVVTSSPQPERESRSVPPPETAPTPPVVTVPTPVPPIIESTATPQSDEYFEPVATALPEAEDDAFESKAEFFDEIASEQDLNLPEETDLKSPGAGSVSDLDQLPASDIETNLSATPEPERAPKSESESESAPSTVSESDDDLLHSVLLDDGELAQHLLDQDGVRDPGSSDSASPVGAEPPLASVDSPAEAIPSVTPPDLDPETRASLRTRLEKLWQETPAPLDLAMLEGLRRLHTVPAIGAEHFQDFINLLIDHTRADALCFLMLDSTRMVYRPLLQRGLDQRTAANFYVGIQDPFVRANQNFQTVRFDAGLAEAFHFKKRFSSQFFQTMDGAYFVSLKTAGVPGFLALMYRDLNVLSEQVLEKNLPPVLRDALPALQRFCEQTWQSLDPAREFEDTSIVDQIYRLLQEVSRGGRDPIHVLHLCFPDLMRQTAWRTRLDRIAETLIAAITPGEKLIEATPERITLILKETPVEQVLGLAREAVGNWGQGLESRTMSFPAHSRNFYNYIDPGF